MGNINILIGTKTETFSGQILGKATYSLWLLVE